MKRFGAAIGAIYVGGIFGIITVTQMRSAIVTAMDVGDWSLAYLLWAGALGMGFIVAAVVGAFGYLAAGEEEEG